MQNLDAATAPYPATPIADESLGTAMLYSSGTTGRPKGILRPLPEQPPVRQLPLYVSLDRLWRYRDGMIYLSPAPLYHSAPQAAVSLTIDRGGTAIIMETFEPEHYLQLVEKYRVTHSQLVPTMFSRMLKLPGSGPQTIRPVVAGDRRPCRRALPGPVKEQMIAWWGPIILEYYGITEAIGFSACDSAEWLAHRGTVGKVVFGRLHVLDADMKPCPAGTPGTLWFDTGQAFEYFNDPAQTKEARSPDGTMSTVGDVGYLDEDGYLYLTDRATFMIISGGVNIYPQECENLLITHPKVADAAVFGVPNEDLGEEVKAAVQLMPGVEPGPEITPTNCSHSARSTWRARNVRARSISKPSCRACRPASSTSACCATAIGPDTRRGLFERATCRYAPCAFCTAGGSAPLAVRCECGAQIVHVARPLFGARGDRIAKPLRGIGIAFEHFQKHRARNAQHRRPFACDSGCRPPCFREQGGLAKQRSRSGDDFGPGSAALPKTDRAILHDIGSVRRLAGGEQNLARFNAEAFGADGENAHRRPAELAEKRNPFKESDIFLDRHRSRIYGTSL